jgi:ABC-2 type transport system permease protein
MINAALTFFYLFTICEFMAFWFDNIWSLGVILRFLTSFLGGALIPLSFFPEWAQSILSYTPFPYLIDFPMKALTGSLTVSTFCINLSIAFAWLLVFRALSKFTWTKGKYSYSGVGM